MVSFKTRITSDGVFYDDSHFESCNLVSGSRWCQVNLEWNILLQGQNDDRSDFGCMWSVSGSGSPDSLFCILRNDENYDGFWWRKTRISRPDANCACIKQRLVMCCTTNSWSVWNDGSFQGSRRQGSCLFRGTTIVDDDDTYWRLHHHQHHRGCADIVSTNIAEETIQHWWQRCSLNTTSSTCEGKILKGISCTSCISGKGIFENRSKRKRAQSREVDPASAKEK